MRERSTVVERVWILPGNQITTNYAVSANNWLCVTWDKSVSPESPNATLKEQPTKQFHSQVCYHFVGITTLCVRL